MLKSLGTMDTTLLENFCIRLSGIPCSCTLYRTLQLVLHSHLSFDRFKSITNYRNNSNTIGIIKGSKDTFFTFRTAIFILLILSTSTVILHLPYCTALTILKQTDSQPLYCRVLPASDWYISPAAAQPLTYPIYSPCHRLFPFRQPFPSPVAPVRWTHNWSVSFLIFFFNLVLMAKAQRWFPAFQYYAFLHSL